MTDSSKIQNQEVLLRLRLFYLDDERSDLDHFKKIIKDFNERPEEFREYDVENISLYTTTDPQEALENFNEVHYDVFLCDHNMPERKGLELIVSLLKPHHNSCVYVLYTGANISHELQIDCDKHQVLLFDKTEDFDVLLQRILRRLPMRNKEQEPTNKLFESYKRIGADLIDEMRSIELSDPSFMYLIGDKEYRPGRLVKEIMSQTELGLMVLESYFEGLKFFKK